jgi:hypothetical protein
MSIVTPPEKTSDSLQYASGFRNGFSDWWNALTRQNQQPPENRSGLLKNAPLAPGTFGGGMTP